MVAFKTAASKSLAGFSDSRAEIGFENLSIGAGNEREKALRTRQRALHYSRRAKVPPSKGVPILKSSLISVHSGSPLLDLKPAVAAFPRSFPSPSFSFIISNNTSPRKEFVPRNIKTNPFNPFARLVPIRNWKFLSEVNIKE